LGISGPTAKALRMSAQPGLTRAVSTRLKLSQDPLVYSFDSPGVMLPFLGKGDRGAERGVKLALIAGIREGSYSPETLASYLLYRLNVLSPLSPVYLSLLPEGTAPTNDLLDFLDLLAVRLGMLTRGGVRDHARAATWFVNWWRQTGCTLSGSKPLIGTSSQGQVESSTVNTAAGGWGFDFQWGNDGTTRPGGQDDADAYIQRKMEAVIDDYVRHTEAEAKEGGVSSTQERKMQKAATTKKREARMRNR